MPDTRTITVALQDGFDKDTVLLSSPGAAEQRLTDVTTRTQISLAREVEISVPADATTLTIALPDHGIAEPIAIPAGGPCHIAVSRSALTNNLAIRRSAEPFGYV